MDVVRPTNEGADAATYPQYQNFFSGSLFNNVGEEGYSLADLQITGPANQVNARNNYIVFWAFGSSIKVDPNRSYWWDPTLKQWRVRDKTNYVMDTKLSKEQAEAIRFNAGEGFLCNFAQNTTKILFRGEVLKGENSTKFRTITRPKNSEGQDYQNFIVANPSGKTLYLTDLTISGPANQVNARNNYIVLMASGPNIKVDSSRAYWWDPTLKQWRIRDKTNYVMDTKLTKEQAEAIKIVEQGQGFMCNFAHATTTLTIPTSL